MADTTAFLVTLNGKIMTNNESNQQTNMIRLESNDYCLKCAWIQMVLIKVTYKEPDKYSNIQTHNLMTKIINSYLNVW